MKLHITRDRSHRNGAGNLQIEENGIEILISFTFIKHRYLKYNESHKFELWYGAREPAYTSSIIIHDDEEAKNLLNEIGGGIVTDDYYNSLKTDLLY